MDPRVRVLYKNLIFTANHYSHLPMSRSRDKIKAAFFGNRNLKIDSVEFKKALLWGKYQIKEMQANHEVKQFRRLRDHYEDEEKESSFETPYSDLTKPPEVKKKKKKDK